MSVRHWSFAAAAVGGAVATFAWLAGWRGGDLAAQIFRIQLFRQSGLTLWNPQWYGGHFTLSYSVLYPPVASVLGIPLTTAVAAAGGAWCFSRIGLRAFGASAHIGVLMFALGTGTQIAIGQLPFLTGEAIALAAYLALNTRRWRLGSGLALVTSLFSPLAGAFLALVIVAWMVTSRHSRWRLVSPLIAVVSPIAATTLLFPGTGSFPYPTGDAIWEIVVILAMLVVVPRRYRALRIAGLLYVVAMMASYAVDTPMGGNVSRLAECVAVPLLACALWSERRLVLVVVAIPMVGWQWTPAWSAMTSLAEEPSTHGAYYAPLVDFVTSQPRRIDRIEIVPTKSHYESAYVAPTIALARGWERQIDTSDNPIFYSDAPLTASTYRAWLRESGVQLVALPDAPLDYAASLEGALLRAGVDGLTPLWHNAHWTVWSVDGSPGLVEGPATLERVDANEVVLTVTAPGRILLRVRYSDNWRVAPPVTCLGPDEHRWITFEAPAAGTYRLTVGLTAGSLTSCADSS